MRKAFLALVAALVILAVVVLANTLLYTSKQLETVPPAPDISLDKTALATRLAEAVRFKTVSHQDPRKLDRQAFLGLHDFLEKSYPNIRQMLTREVVNNYSLLYTWKGSDAGQKPILLMAHLDVMPVELGTESDWDYPPFSGHIADGYIWGRGTMDDKVSVLGILEAVEFLLGKGFWPKRTMYLGFGHDEEAGGEQGAAKIAAILKSRGVALEYLIDEGSAILHGIIPGIGRPVAMVGIAEKGYMTLELTVKSNKAKGACGHSSMPPRHTLIGILSTAIHKLEASPMPASIQEPVRRLFDYVGPEMSFLRRMIFANLWLFEPVVKRQLAGSPATNAIIRTTTAVTMIQGGIKENVLPCEAKAITNSRILHGDSLAIVTESLRQAIDDPRITIRQMKGNEPSPISNTGSVSFQTLNKTIRQVFPGTVVAPGLTIGGTDTKHYVALSDAAYRFLPLRLKRGDLRRFHGTNERVAIDNYANIVRFYAQLIRNSDE